MKTSVQHESSPTSLVSPQPQSSSSSPSSRLWTLFRDTSGDEPKKRGRLFQKRFDVGRRLQSQLHQTERLLDTAYESIARLNAELPAARLEARVAASFGHEAFEAAVATQNHILRARSALLAMHAALDLARQAAQLPAHAFGGGALKPIPASADLGNNQVGAVSDNE